MEMSFQRYAIPGCDIAIIFYHVTTSFHVLQQLEAISSLEFGLQSWIQIIIMIFICTIHRGKEGDYVFRLVLPHAQVELCIESQKPIVVRRIWHSLT